MTRRSDPDSCPVRLLLISHSYPPVLGGTETEAQRIAAALIGRGHRVNVLCAGGAPLPDVPRWIDDVGVPVRIFGRRSAGRLRDCAFALGVAWTLWWDRRDYDLVYFLMHGLHLAAGLPVAHWLRKPILMKVSGSGIITTVMRPSWLGRLELRWLRKWAHRTMILNPGMAEEARDAGFDESRLYWMPNPVDTGEFAPSPPALRAEVRARLGILPSARVIIFAGRLAPEKELGSLIEAFGQVARQAHDVLLAVVGDGPLRGELQDAACRHSVSDRVRFTGRQTSAGTREWFQASDIFALVSSNEGFSCSLAESMSTGLAAVVSEIPANAQLIDDGIHGLRVPVRNVGLIVEALMSLLSDEDRRLRMGAAARQRIVENYSTDRIIARYEELFADALCSGKRPVA